jgi:glycosyltransferase involved in cell wall biosynthesis
VRIAINTRFLLKDKMEGFGWYTYETISRIVKKHPEHQFIFLFDRKFDPEFVFASNVEPHAIGLPARHPILFYLWYEFAVTQALKKYKADIFVSPDGYLSLRTETPSLAVIHDLNFEHHPEDLPVNVLKYYKKNFPLFAKKAQRIVTVSEFSKNDIAKTYQCEPEKIDVGYNGANESLHPLLPAEIKIYRDKMTHGRPYFIFIGALTPRKNLARLFAAFDDFYEKSAVKIPLLVVGEKYFWNEEIKNAFEKSRHKEQIIFTGHLQREELNSALASALALAYVSYFEGFGIPLVEAMRSGIPVLTSNKTSLPEVAGDAALLCDPFSIAAITEGLLKMANDGNLRKDLIEKGFKRAENFSWDKTADVLWNSIMKVANAEK